MLSQTAEYALRAVVHLAQQDSETLTPVGDIATALDVPANYLSKILNLLARTGVLESTRGPRGGFRLGAPADTITLAEVVGAFDSLKEQKRCLLGRPRCSDANPCGAHERWKLVKEPMVLFFEQTTVADVLGTVAVPSAARRRT
jgi:Rrf2 family protein